MENNLPPVTGLEMILFEAASQPMFILSVEPDDIFRCIAVNTAYCEATGMMKEDVINKTTGEILNPEAAANAVAGYKKAIATGRPVKYTEKVYFNDVLHIVETTLSPVLDIEGRCIFLIGSSIDIKYREEITGKLNILVHTLKSINECVSITDTDNIIIYVNNAFLKNYGYANEEEVLGKHISILRPPDYKREDLEQSTQATLEGGWQGEIINQRKDGSLFPLYLSSGVVYDDYGDVLALVGVANDITEKKAAEEAKKRSEEKYRLLADNASDAIAMYDKNHKIIYLSPAFEKLTGYQLHEIYKLNIFDLVYPADFETLYNEVSNADAQRYPTSNHTYRLTPKSGKPIWVETSATRIFGQDGNIERVITVSRDITSRKQMEADLLKAKEIAEENQARFAQIADFTGDFIWETNINGLYTYVNQAVEKITGYKPEELINKLRFHDLLTGESKEAVTRLCFEHLANREPMINLHNEILAKNGQTVQLVTNAFPFYDTNGNFAGFRGSDRDITERIRSKKALADSEQKYRQLVENINDVIFSLSSEGIILYISPSVKALSGFEDHEYIGKHFSEFAHPDDLDLLIKSFPEIKAGKISADEFRIKSRSGKEVWVQSTTRPVSDPGEHNEYTGIAKDITEKKLIENDLQMQSQLRKVLLDISANFINLPLQDIEGSINQALQIMAEFVGADRAYIFDYDFEKQICVNTFEWCSEGTSPQIDELKAVPLSEMMYWVEAHSLGEAIYIPDVFQLPPGGVRAILEPQEVKSLLSVPLLEGKDCIGFVGFDSVKKHHIYSEYELQLLSVFGQMLVNIGQRLKTGKELIAAKEKAEAGDRMKTNFINSISHEIRTPLNGLLGFGNIMVRSDLSETERYEHYKILKESSERLIQTITDYIDISLINTGSLNVKKYRFSITNLMNELLFQTETACDLKGLTVSLEMPEMEGELFINSDKELIRKILKHLLSNAVKFTSEGSVKFGMKRLEHGLAFYVQDSGIGISEEAKWRLFRPFTQEEEGITRNYEGSGLGLAICKGMLEKLSGTIEFETEKGKGSSFTVEIPLSANDISIESYPGSEVKLKPDNPVILIAEDNTMNLKFIEVVLRKMGFSVISAENGLQTVRLCQQHPEIVAVIMDIRMPRMGGIEATQKIREFNPELPIIAITAYAQTGSEAGIIEAGCTDFIAKPVEKENLIAVLSRLGLYKE